MFNSRWDYEGTLSHTCDGFIAIKVMNILTASKNNVLFISLRFANLVTITFHSVSVAGENKRLLHEQKKCHDTERLLVKCYFRSGTVGWGERYGV